MEAATLEASLPSEVLKIIDAIITIPNLILQFESREYVEIGRLLFEFYNNFQYVDETTGQYKSKLVNYIAHRVKTIHEVDIDNMNVNAMMLMFMKYHKGTYESFSPIAMESLEEINEHRAKRLEECANKIVEKLSNNGEEIARIISYFSDPTRKDSDLDKMVDKFSLFCSIGDKTFLYVKQEAEEMVTVANLFAETEDAFYNFVSKRYLECVHRTIIFHLKVLDIAKMSYAGY
jgi:hypothetical protein